MARCFSKEQTDLLHSQNDDWMKLMEAQQSTEEAKAIVKAHELYSRHTEQFVKLLIDIVRDH